LETIDPPRYTAAAFLKELRDSIINETVHPDLSVLRGVWATAETPQQILRAFGVVSSSATDEERSQFGTDGFFYDPSTSFCGNVRMFGGCR
jgi:hypothetical protein